MLDVVKEGPDEPRFACRRPLVFGGFEKCCTAGNALRPAAAQEVVWRDLCGVDPIDAGQHLRRQRVEARSGLRRRKTEIDRRRMVRRERDEQSGLTLFQNELVRQPADPFRDPVIEQRDLLHVRVMRLRADGKRIQGLKAGRCLDAFFARHVGGETSGRFIALELWSNTPPSGLLGL